MLIPLHALVTLVASAGATLLILCMAEYGKRSVRGRLVGTAWLAFSAFFVCVAMGLNILDATWHLRNAQKPWGTLAMLDLAGVICAIIGGIVFVKAGRAAESVIKPAAPAEEVETPSGVWPPAPRQP